jgi:hypothetical protein
MRIIPFMMPYALAAIMLGSWQSPAASAIAQSSTDSSLGLTEGRTTGTSRANTASLWSMRRAGARMKRLNCCGFTSSARKGLFSIRFCSMSRQLWSDSRDLTTFSQSRVSATAL